MFVIGAPANEWVSSECELLKVRCFTRGET